MQCKSKTLFACILSLSFFFFKQKTAYEMRISDWSSDVCSSDLSRMPARPFSRPAISEGRMTLPERQLANAIRALAMDAVQAANSGHPGMPMGMTDVAKEIGRASCRERVCQ